MNIRIRKALNFLKTQDYRHYINIGITCVFVVLGVWIFPNAILRLAETLRDICTSTAYTFCEWFLPENNVVATVNTLPAWEFVPSRFEPLKLLPTTWEEFQVKWAKYWQVWTDSRAFIKYLILVLIIIESVYIVIVCTVILCIPIYALLKRYIQKHNNDYDKESTNLQRLKWFSDKTYRRAKKWVLDYVGFCKDHPVYVKTWLALWGLYLNVFSICSGVVAYLVYFLSSFDFTNIYTQVYKLTLDLTTAVRFIPVILWIVAVIGVLEYWARQIGYNRLDHREAKNGGFVDERGVVTIVYGPMGAGKTKLITDMSLTAEVKLRDMAFEIIIESDFKFPNMTWQTLGKELRKAIAKHEVFSVPTVRRWLKEKYRKWQRKPCAKNLFGYDYNRYGLTYEDGLKVSHVWEVIDDYACAYFVYTVQSSLLVANYSIRTDNLLQDVGNFPLWNTDFFKRDVRLMESYSRQAHIIDFDMLRLGKKLLEDNPNRYAFGFGVYVISEIDKERKNDKELRESGVKASEDECNQKNDLFNTLLKMSRHACVIANRVFVKIFADLQRPESLGADARELGEIHYIEDKGEMSPILPFFAPFYLVEALFTWTFGKIVNLYTEYSFNRADKTVPMYLLKNFTASIKRFKDKTCNTFDSSSLKLKVESGRMDGESVERKYFLQAKKIYSKRYSTDCLSGIFERYAKENTIGINDLPEYAGIMATQEELLLQNSFFQVEVQGLNVA